MIVRRDMNIKEVFYCVKIIVGRKKQTNKKRKYIVADDDLFSHT